MPGTSKSGRPGGNPDLWREGKKRQKGKQPLKATISFRVTEEMANALKSGALGKSWADIPRQALIEALKKQGIKIEW